LLVCVSKTDSDATNYKISAKRLRVSYTTTVTTRTADTAQIGGANGSPYNEISGSRRIVTLLVDRDAFYQGESKN